jgi:catechol 2,3-dioxygenase-like lactoylglutathione lyase family enzyme
MKRKQVPMQIDHLDHLVLTVQDIQTTCEFYSRFFNPAMFLSFWARWSGQVPRNLLCLSTFVILMGTCSKYQMLSDRFV